MQAWVFSGYSSFLPQFQNMTDRLISLSKLPLGQTTTHTNSQLCVSVLPFDGLATCPGCTPPLSGRLLEIGTSYPTNQCGRSGYRKWMDELNCSSQWVVNIFITVYGFRSDLHQSIRLKVSE
ncbi:hypothetical protein ILYODFUR_037560 [Ilyodon furcidens]|uniref:Uncharacterized protein n=1 Tax=Ilyodon furcidens TaxID=33524 RepID=A0ABV0UR12_9TELE